MNFSSIWKLQRFFFLWGEIKWLCVTYGMFQKMFLQQSSQLLADIAGFFSSSNRRQCFICLLFRKFCDNSWRHKSDICSHNCSMLCLLFKENCWWRDYLFLYDWVTPSSGIFCLNIYNQIAVGKKHRLWYGREPSLNTRSATY